LDPEEKNENEDEDDAYRPPRIYCVARDGAFYPLEGEEGGDAGYTGLVARLFSVSPYSLLSSSSPQPAFLG
jgi:hypothetical protein